MSKSHRRVRTGVVTRTFDDKPMHEKAETMMVHDKRDSYSMSVREETIPVGSIEPTHGNCIVRTGRLDRKSRRGETRHSKARVRDRRTGRHLVLSSTRHIMSDS
jgi:hypothetical protein